jgi:hypothetical protein
MSYLKCFGVGVFLALAGGVAWLLYSLQVRSGASSDVNARPVSVDIRSLADNRFLMVILILFVAGFFFELLVVRRRLLHSRH